MTFIPLMINLNEKKVVVIGGGSVAEKRIRHLKESGALITVISPEITEEIRKDWETGKIKWIGKKFETADIQDAFLILIATSNQMVNQSVLKAAPSHVLVNDATDAHSGNVTFPASFRRGRLSISISTDGASPHLSAEIKRRIQTLFDEDYEEYLEFLDKSRRLLKQTSLSNQMRKMLLKEMIDERFLNKDIQSTTLRWFTKMVEERRSNGERPRE
ncbi:NAD(P)-binding protein [Oceanobacillus piezotolerans]|uniref:precorrin-2 dehydrogenase n=1 Tax=Oceanobacillus piezotolerans TaxID=2448030 RepID=A0A498D9G4_9BACI|nr:NAD(P)-binding protein [Oceanobacillus piezotolerans]RLL47744.1 NAD(P)-binding protein [Oceanobacillus piezotolerans]